MRDTQDIFISCVNILLYFKQQACQFRKWHVFRFKCSKKKMIYSNLCIGDYKCRAGITDRVPPPPLTPICSTYYSPVLLLTSAHKRATHKCRLTIFICSVARWQWSKPNKSKEVVYKSFLLSKIQSCEN